MIDKLLPIIRILLAAMHLTFEFFHISVIFPSYASKPVKSYQDSDSHTYGGPLSQKDSNFHPGRMPSMLKSFVTIYYQRRRFATGNSNSMQVNVVIILYSSSIPIILLSPSSRIFC